MERIRRIVVVFLTVAAAAVLTDRTAYLQGYSASEGVRRPAVAGRWYEGTPPALKREVERYLSKAKPDPQTKGRLIALIEPHAGYVYSGRPAAYGYKLLEKGKIKRVILLGPNHYPLRDHPQGFKGVSIPDVKFYQTPLGLVPVDRKTCDALVKEELFNTIPEAHRREHSLEAQLPFLQHRLGETFEIVPLLCGRLEDAEIKSVAEALKEYLTERTLVVVSSDFTHYGRRFGYVPFRTDVKENLKKLDMGAVQRIVAGKGEEFLRYQRATGATICGRLPIAVLLAMLPEKATGELLCYTTSGAMTGDYSMSVSYATISFRVDGEAKGAKAVEMGELTGEEQEMLLAVARRALERFVREGKKLEVDSERCPARLRCKCGVFVSLKRQGKLRGCIGYVIGREPLIEAVRDNAINAAANDPRFESVRSEELDEIEIEISVMSPLKPVSDPNEIVVGTHGLVIQKFWNQGLLLPQVPTEYGWTREQYLAAICRKAGLARGEWRTAKLHTFTAQVFREKE